jgi:hypothetical protein
VIFLWKPREQTEEENVAALDIKIPEAKTSEENLNQVKMEGDTLMVRICITIIGKWKFVDKTPAQIAAGKKS